MGMSKRLPRSRIMGNGGGKKTAVSLWRSDASGGREGEKHKAATSVASSGHMVTS